MASKVRCIKININAINTLIRESAHKSANKLAAHTNVALDVYTANTHCSRESHVQARTTHVKVTCKYALLT